MTLFRLDRLLRAERYMMRTRLLVLKLTATFSLWLCGCNMPTIPNVNTQPQQHNLTIKVEDGRIKIDDAKIDVAVKQSQAAAEPCPCCGLSQRCQGLCGKPGCTCSANLKPSDVSAPTRTPKPNQLVYQCRNGVCGWYPVETNQPKAKSAPSSELTIYDNGSPAGRAMRAAIGDDGIEWTHGQPPIALGGFLWYPTAIKADGSSWTPGQAGWHSGSLAEFNRWRQ